MNDKRPAPKRRSEPCGCDRSKRPKRPARSKDANYSAPSHMGGNFSEAGYDSGRGVFGFTQET